MSKNKHKPFMWAVADNEGRAVMDEGCVATHPIQLADVWAGHMEDHGYKVIPVYSGPHIEAMKEKLEQTERERDEARAALAVERQHRDGHLPSCAGIDREEGRCGCGYLDGTAYRDMTERMEQATALLREWRDAYEHEDNGTWLARCCDVRDRADAFLAGKPAHNQTKE